MELTEAVELDCDKLQPTFVPTQEIAMTVLELNEDEDEPSLNDSDICNPEMMCIQSINESRVSDNTGNLSRTAFDNKSETDGSITYLEANSSTSSELDQEHLKVEDGTHEPSKITNKNIKRKRKRKQGVCHVCGLVLHREDYLQVHIASVHDTTKEFKCNECDHTTNCKRYLLRHYKLNHGFSNVFSCANCDFKSPTLIELRAHIDEYHKIRDYPCIYCDFKATKKRNLYTHIKAQHEPPEVNKCAHCNFKTRWKSHMYFHVKTKHTNDHETVHKCQECPFSTKWRSHLYKHVKDKHTDEKEVKMYNCQNCEFQTRWQSHLYKHRKTKHPDVSFARERPGRKLKTHPEAPISSEPRTVVGDGIVHNSDTLEAGSSISKSSYSGTFSSVWESFAMSLTDEMDAQNEVEEEESAGSGQVSRNNRDEHTDKAGSDSEALSDTILSRTEVSHSKRAKNYRRHLRRSKCKFHVCKYCDFQAERKSDLEDHFRKVHLKKKSSRFKETKHSVSK